MASTATRSAPASATASASASEGVMYTSVPGVRRLTRPITGTPTASLIARIVSTPSVRMPTAPPASTARAIAARCSGAASGLPGAAWTDTTRPPRIRSSASFTATSAESPARPAAPRANSASSSAPASGSPSGSTIDEPGSRASTSLPERRGDQFTRPEHAPRVRDDHLLPRLEQPPRRGARADRQLAGGVGEDRAGVLVAALGGSPHVLRE